jgi:hypothetical protein
MAGQKRFGEIQQVLGKWDPDSKCIDLLKAEIQRQLFASFFKFVELRESWVILFNLPVGNFVNYKDVTLKDDSDELLWNFHQHSMAHIGRHSLRSNEGLKWTVTTTAMSQ